MIEATGLSKYYGHHKAIEGVNFQIGAGEIVGLLGLNGAGKSTILKILGCFLTPSRGMAKVDGHSVDDDPHRIRRVIGYLPDTAPLYDEMTVQGYLRFVAGLKEVPSDRLEEAVARAIERTSLKDVMDVRLGELSHGFRQRVGIAQAIVHDPKVLILDEPINGLDPKQIVEMRDLILSFRGQHTVILSSHILSEITRTCDRILIIDKGRLVAEGSETSLQSMVEKNMRLVLEVTQVSEQLMATLRGLHGVEKVSDAGGPAGLGANPQLTIETNQDIRSEVAKTIIESGTGLLGLRREDAGLENVFMKLIQSS